MVSRRPFPPCGAPALSSPATKRARKVRASHGVIHALLVGGGAAGLSAASCRAGASATSSSSEPATRGSAPVSRSPAPAAACRSSTASGPARAPRPATAASPAATCGPATARWSAEFGEARAKAIQAEAKTAREDLAEFIAREAIDCDFRLTGRFTGAAKPGEYEGLAREADLLRKTLGIEAYAVPRCRAAQRAGNGILPRRHGAQRHRRPASGQAPPRHAGAGREGRRDCPLRDRGARLRRQQRRLRRRDGPRPGAGRPRHRRHQRLHRWRRPLAAPPAGARAQPHHRHRPALQQPDVRADAQARHVLGDAQAALLLSAFARRHAHPVRRPRRHDCRRARPGRPTACAAR